jgi:hypothetical protein
VTTSNRHSRPGETGTPIASLGRAEQRATIVGSLAGAIAGVGGFYATMAPQQWLYMRYLALVLGIGPGSRTRGGVAGSIAKSWALWLGLALLLGVGFARLVSRSRPAYADDVSRSVESYPDLEAVFGPALDRAPLTTTTTATGIRLVYGVVASVVVGMLLLPMTVSWFVPVY